MQIQLTRRDVERFWNNVIRLDNKCWQWIAATSTYGYGKMWICGQLINSHRISWIIHYGEIPVGKSVLHRCDNPPCTNPKHLFLGTQGDNVRDAVKKGRQFSPQRGITHCRHGHPFSPNNTRTIISKRTGLPERECVVCRRDTQRRYRQRLAQS
jgi:hypothetical protein